MDKIDLIKQENVFRRVCEQHAHKDPSRQFLTCTVKLKVKRFGFFKNKFARTLKHTDCLTTLVDWSK
jgi:hypothetical protein